MLELRRLRLLHEFKLRGTIAEVAEALSYSTSSVSQQLSVLESEAGAALFQKNGRRLELTPQGELLAAFADAQLQAHEEVLVQIENSLDAITGVLRIAVFQSVSHSVIPLTLRTLEAQHPALRIEIIEQAPEAGLFGVSAREYDVALAEQYPGRPRAARAGLDRVVLGYDAIRFASATDLKLAGLHEASALPWVIEPEGTASREWTIDQCRKAGFEPDIRFETADLMTHISLISDGHAVGLLPDLVWARHRAELQLQPLPGAPLREIFSACRESSAKRRSIEAFRAALAQASETVLGRIADRLNS